MAGKSNLHYFDVSCIHGIMEIKYAVKKLAAIAHEGRLTLFRRLIEAGPDGLAAGALAEYANVGATTASAQLASLDNAGLVQSRRDGRQIIYSADYGAMTELLQYLLTDCCAGSPLICNALVAAKPPKGAV